MKTKIIKMSEKLDQSRSNDNMIGHICIVEWYNTKGKVVQLSTHELWFDSTNILVIKPIDNMFLAHGHYFMDTTKINDEVLFDYHRRCLNLFKQYVHQDIDPQLTREFKRLQEKIYHVKGGLDDINGKIDDIQEEIGEQLTAMSCYEYSIPLKDELNEIENSVKKLKALSTTVCQTITELQQ